MNYGYLYQYGWIQKPDIEQKRQIKECKIQKQVRPHDDLFRDTHANGKIYTKNTGMISYKIQKHTQPFQKGKKQI